MAAIRCVCGKLASTKGPCKVCDSTEHLIHCHHPRDGMEKDHWRTCPEAQEHAHVYTDGDHEHE